jgi:hypothetical protein
VALLGDAAHLSTSVLGQVGARLWMYDFACQGTILLYMQVQHAVAGCCQQLQPVLCILWEG